MNERSPLLIGTLWLCLAVFGTACGERARPGDADADSPNDADGDDDGDGDTSHQTDGDIDADGDPDGDSDADPFADADSEAGADGDVVLGPRWTPPELIVELPPEPPLGTPFPLIARTAGAEPRTETVTVALDGVPLAGLRLYRGRGSATLSIDRPGKHRLSFSARGEPIAARIVRVAERPVRQLRGRLAGDDLRWGGGEEIRLVETVTVPRGASLEVGAGARVLVAATANLVVQGELHVRGTAEAPALFSRIGEQPWGGIRILDGASGELIHALLTGGGGDRDFRFGHSGSQPVVFVERAELMVEGGGAIDNAGKGYSSSRSRVTIRDVVISRCDTGGEHRRSQVTFESNHVLELPDADGRLDDDDNDGIYLDRVLVEDGEPLPSHIRDSVFALGEDDGIDQNGALVVVEGCWIEGFHHEGIAASNSHGVTARDSVILGCGQGIEAGYGHPEVVVEHCLVAGNGVGLRFGDSYDTPSEGRLTARHTIVVGSWAHNVYNFVDVMGGPNPEGLDIACSLVNAPGWDGEAGNVAGEATWDQWGCAVASVELPGSCAPEPLGPRTCR